MTEAQRQHRFRVALAFALVYVLWGSTYLAIRVAVEHISPALMTGTRFLIAGSVMLAWCAARRRKIWVRRSDLLRLATVGVLLLTTGNMVLAWAEQWIPSGLSALIAAVMPIFVAILEAGVFKAERLRRRGLIGLALGFLGLIILLWPDLRSTSAIGHLQLIAAGGVIAAAFAWALGALLSRRWAVPVDAFIATGWEMLIAGALNFLLGTVTGDWARTRWTATGVAAVVYLIIFGSWIGFSAYIWLLNNVPTAKVATHAYVNPVVAVFLGWLILKEAVTGYILAGTIIVIAAVALVNSSKLKPAEAPQGGATNELPVCEPSAG
jgi:drug/metabolite transporter (DMT)-like permease